MEEGWVGYKTTAWLAYTLYGMEKMCISVDSGGRFGLNSTKHFICTSQAKINLFWDVFALEALSAIPQKLNKLLDFRMNEVHMRN